MYLRNEKKFPFRIFAVKLIIKSINVFKYADLNYTINFVFPFYVLVYLLCISKLSLIIISHL